MATLPSHLPLGWNRPPQPPPEPLVTATAKGISGRSYQFQIHQIGTAYFDRSGVYMFLKRAANGAWDAVYIGETHSFAKRLYSDLTLHHQWQSVRAHHATHIGTLFVPGGLTVRENIETDLRRAIATPCNRQ